MSRAYWYYCNLPDEASLVVPIVQAHQNAACNYVEVFASTFTAELTLETAIDDDELAVARSAYVLVAATLDSTGVDLKKAETKTKVNSTKTERKVAAQSSMDATVKLIPTETALAAEELATEEKRRDDSACVSEESIAAGNAASVTVNIVEKKPTVVQAFAEDTATVEISAGDAATETILKVETMEKTPKVVEFAGKEEYESVMAQNGVDDEKLINFKQLTDEPIAEPVVAEDVTTMKTVAALSTSSVSSDKLATRHVTDEVVLESKKVMTFENSILEGQGEPVAIVETADIQGEEQSTLAKTVRDDESETETQSEKSEMNVTEAVETDVVVRVVAEPDSEIGETMVINPVVAAKEDAAQTSSFGFIPEQLRKNSYAVSSVAVAVTTAIVATLMARR
ncbi:uncharacterized protein PHALS_07783 [Plasmopara halstedii]|uniref:Uncharacterized protein n=1 Tax=Plasmopara halstedii TaxID=4781 RepID=A0A0P1B8C2_PLAHL|nr:uncharacterized protein PHALS_07783 [Plasmopara halstedii]CEG50054.1 hypothetical protein PHALS_07783 [Plasmopara halstedii]|eukprot:XP_024586423.1 hypothetical protein PHALS_07783 [Plasmopara halstedii]